MASLGNDLKQLRKKQDLTLEDIRDETKIPIRILQAIENDTIFTDFDENRTYIRSFVRSYGKALRIDDHLMRIALDQTEAGQYQDLLQKVDPYNPGEIKDEPPFSIPDQKKKSKKKWRNRREKKSESKPAEDHKHDPESIKDLTGQYTPSERSINWADVGRRFRSMERGTHIWILLISIILILIILGYFFFYESGAEQQNPPLADSLANIEQDFSNNDSLQLELSDTSSANNTAQSYSSATLPDTLQLIIYAANGKLEPVRVKSDLFQQTYPYWIEQGNAMRFNFMDTIRVQGQFSRMILLMNGHQIRDFASRFYQSDDDEIEITRSYFEDDPKWKDEPRPINELNIPVPDTILNRPTFNQE